MKSITESIKKLNTEKQKELARFLKSDQSGEKALSRALLSITGLYSILKNLSTEERRIVRIVYTEGDGITLGELEKKMNTGIPDLEHMTRELSQRLMVYVIKNRQLLTNKLDKIYAIDEVSSLLNIKECSDILEKLKKQRICLEQKKTDPALLEKVNSAKTEKLLQYIADSGGIAFFEDVSSLFSPSTLNNILEKALEEKLVSLYHNLDPDFRTYIVINEKLLPLMIRESGDEKGKTPGVIHNGYRFIINMLHAYDSISTYGLFLTKQMQFRKIDYKRIVTSMINLRNTGGELADRENICQLALFFLVRLKALRLQKDISKISLSKLKNDLENPQNLTVRMLQSLDDPKNTHELFMPPFAVPSYRLAQLIIRTLHVLSETGPGYLKTILMTSIIIETGRKNLAEAIVNRDKRIKEVDSALELLCLLGLISISGSIYSLSDAGCEVARLLKLKTPEQDGDTGRCVYINPDFSLMVPVRELPSSSLFIIMAWTQMIKDDVILNAQISRSSIITAHKRGLSLTPFMETLARCSKNEIPQNMKFQLNEWSRQTLKITVTESTILKSSDPGFFDEITYSKFPSAIVEIINPNYAIIDRKYLDDIIKLAGKHNAVISLFEETAEGEDK